MATKSLGLRQIMQVFALSMLWVLPEPWGFGTVVLWKISNIGNAYVTEHRQFVCYDESNQRPRL